MQPRYQYGDCIACNQAITNPICQECLYRDIEGWLKRRNPRLLLSLRRKTVEYIKLGDYSNNIECIYCEKKMNACAFCYIHFVEEWIYKKYPRLLAEFKRYFDFG